MATQDKLTEQITIAAEGIKQLVEQGKKTLSATEHLARGSSPVARAFSQAGIEAFEARASGGRSLIPALPPGGGALLIPSISPAVQNGISQIQSASKPQSRQVFPESFEAIQARMLHAVNTGGNPVAAARAGSGIPLQPSQWPPGMPGLPVGSPGNPAPPGMPPLPTPAVPSPASPGQAGGARAGGGFFSPPSWGQVAIGAGAGLGIARLITGQTVGEFSAGHGLSQWNTESAAGAAHVSSLTNMLLQGAGDIAKGVGKYVKNNVLDMDQGTVNMFRGLAGRDDPRYFDPKFDPGFDAVVRSGHNPMADPKWQHEHASGKTSVGDGPK